MNDNFHDLFKQSVPEAPSTGGWVEGARRRRRGRQVVTGGVAGLAVVALAVPVALNLSAGSAPVVASPEPSVSAPAPTASPEPTGDPAPTAGSTSTDEPGLEVSLSPRHDGLPGASVCHDEAGEPVADSLLAGTIPTGAARAWLCTNPNNYGTVGPLEPLVTDVDGLIEALYEQPGLTDDTAQEIAEAYTVVLEFEDGRKMSFTGDIQDGTSLSDGENSLQGSVAFYRDEVEARWLAQRSEAGAPVGEYVAQQECPLLSYQRSLLPVSLDSVTGGYACASEGDMTRAVELRESLAAEIGREALANGVPVEASEEGGNSALVLANTWGDQILLRKAGSSYEFRGEDHLMGWTPTPEFAAELDALFGG